jgi:hypothetical protein
MSEDEWGFSDAEYVAIPRRKHEHSDGSRCVLTTWGRWKREGLGMDEDADCPDKGADDAI